jgi:hypothetical protein
MLPMMEKDLPLEGKDLLNLMDDLDTYVKVRMNDPLKYLLKIKMLVELVLLELKIKMITSRKKTKVFLHILSAFLFTETACDRQLFSVIVFVSL